ncbi:ATP-binding cassette domain-containing protein [Streptomyces inhibens]|uniref:ATP-binding cassette domain-containing protein n=1 Tax=Streptomyces inhibens TaxID=2293571 RepID=UPI0037AE882E
MDRGEATGRASGHTAIEAIGLGKRYRRRWALRDCTFRLPAGRICALVGPAGAGKSTLLALASGLTRPTEGTVRVCGAGPATPDGRARVAHVTQGRPLYPRLTVAETLRLGRELNPGRWDRRCAEQIVYDGRVPLDARVGTLSGEQRTHLALALAFAKDPELLLLDELPPYPGRAGARLFRAAAGRVPPFGPDPLVRHRIAALLLARAAEHGTTVVLSSHLLAELDGVCDYLLVLGGGRVRLAGEVDDVIGAHALVMGPRRGDALPPRIAAHTVVEARMTDSQFTAVVRRQGTVAAGPWEAVEPSLEELLLAYLRAPDAPGLIAPSAEPVSPRLRRRPGNKPGIPGMPRNGPSARPDLPPVRHGPPGGAAHTQHDHQGGKGAAA